MRWALRTKRLERRWTQGQAARSVGISRSFYGMIELGQRSPTLKLAQRLARVFDLDIETLFF